MSAERRDVIFSIWSAAVVPFNLMMNRVFEIYIFIATARRCPRCKGGRRVGRHGSVVQRDLWVEIGFAEGGPEGFAFR